MASNPFSHSCDLGIVKIERELDALPCILDGRFFIYSEKDSTNTKKVAICTSCLPKEVKISGFNNSTSNFVTHLKRKHGHDVFKKYQSYLKSVKKNKQTLRTSTRYRYPETSRTSSSYPAETTVSQEQFNENILNFFNHSMIPLQAIDDPYFKNIFNGFNMSAKGLNIINRSALGNLIEDSFLKEITNIKNELYNVKEVCTSADIWLANSRSFFAVTAHWIDSDLKRKSRTMACRGFSGKHSYDQIAFLIEAVHAEFGLDSQRVLATVTDCGNNFENAFKEFGVDMENYNSSESEEDPRFTLKYEVDPLATVEHISPQPKLLDLPDHLRCCAYKLNLCVTMDANNVLRNNETTIAHIHNPVIKKCNDLWNLASCPKLAEVIYNILGHTLSKPGTTRWNELYDALRQIASIQDKSVQLHQSLGLTNVLRDCDFQYITEYLNCSKPIAEALDILQGDEDMYYGILLPCLLSLRKKLKKLNTETLIYCKQLAEKYLESVEARFAEFFDFSSKVAQNAVIAAMSYPRFKDKWIVCINVEQQSSIRSIFKEAVGMETHEEPESFPVVSNFKYDDSYFEFDTGSSETDSGGVHQVQRSKADVIISNYLADQDRDVSMLNEYPEIKSVFKKYNTPLPSSGPVDRLFSYATMTNLPTLQKLSDEMVEKRLLLKSNLRRTVQML